MLISEQIELTGDAKHHHIPGSPIIYRHGWKKVTAQPADQLSAQIEALVPHLKKRYQHTGGLPGELTAMASAPLVHPKVTQNDSPRRVEQLRLLSMWTRSFRMRNTTQGTPRDAQFIDELHRMLTDHKPPPGRKLSPGASDAHEFLTMVDQLAKPVDSEMARGLSLNTDDIASLYPVGGHVDLPIVSWSKSPSVAKSYAESHPARPGKTHVVIHLPPGSMGMELTPIERGAGSWLSLQAQQDEVLTGGRFPVQRVVPGEKSWDIYLGKQERFRAQ
jgi:hypothetical protein